MADRAKLSGVTRAVSTHERLDNEEEIKGSSNRAQALRTTARVR